MRWRRPVGALSEGDGTDADSPLDEPVVEALSEVSATPPAEATPVVELGHASRSAGLSRFLPWRSIRGQVTGGLVALSGLVLLLTMAALFGLTCYHGLAESISQRATELPLATALSRDATTAKVSYTRIQPNWDELGMIESELLCRSNSELANQEFESTLDSLDTNLARYRTLIDSRDEERVSDPADWESGDANGLIDTVQQRKNLEGIEETLQKIHEARKDIRTRYVVGDGRGGKLDRLLDQLIRQTHEHLGLMHQQMGAFSERVHGEYRAGVAALWIVTLVSLAVILWIFWYCSSNVLAPFRTLLVGCRLVENGQFGHRIDLGTDDELGELASAMNDMTDRFQSAYRERDELCQNLDRQVQERSREVIRNEQLASVGFLAAGFAHEINNPMATIAWSAEALESRWTELQMLAPEDRLVDEDLLAVSKTNLERIQNEAFRCKGITEKMLDFSRLGDSKRVRTELTSLVRDVAAMVGTVGKFRCKQIDVHADQAVSAHVNPPEVRQVILNLMANALESVDERGHVRVHVLEQEEMAIVQVHDNGCGMSREVQEQLFEPFFTRRRDGTGTGLGLSISYRIVSQHGGTLSAHSEGEGQGACFELRLPIRAATEDTFIAPPPRRFQNHATVNAA
ncbi:MAG: HAMP domain-containing sensor histidine kinase [Planctomycetota bacterium]